MKITAYANTVCSEHFRPVITWKQASELAEKYNSKYSDLPKEIQLGIKHRILYPEELEAYLVISKKWFARAPILKDAFEKSKFFRKFVNEPNLIKEFSSNIASGGLSTTMAHKTGLILDPMTNAPIYTIDMLAGLILDAEVTLLTSKTPRYYQELIRRGIVPEGKINQLKSSINTGFTKTFSKVNAKLNKHFNKMEPIIEDSAEKIANASLKSGHITKEYLKTAKLHIKNMLTLSTYFGLGGFLTAHAYTGVQKLMFRFGNELVDPYVGFSAMTEVEHFAMFSISSYMRMILTKSVAGKTEGYLNRVLKLGDSKTLGKISQKLTGDEQKFANNINNSIIFSSVFGIYFMNNLWGATLYMKYRDGDYDPSYIVNPYQDEIKSFWKSYTESFESNDMKEDLIEIQSEVSTEGLEICPTESSCVNLEE